MANLRLKKMSTGKRRTWKSNKYGKLGFENASKPIRAHYLRTAISALRLASAQKGCRVFVSASCTHPARTLRSFTLFDFLQHETCAQRVEASRSSPSSIHLIRAWLGSNLACYRMLFRRAFVCVCVCVMIRLGLTETELVRSWSGQSMRDLKGGGGGAGGDNKDVTLLFANEKRLRDNSQLALLAREKHLCCGMRRRDETVSIFRVPPNDSSSLFHRLRRKGSVGLRAGLYLLSHALQQLIVSSQPELSSSLPSSSPSTSSRPPLPSQSSDPA